MRKSRGIEGGGSERGDRERERERIEEREQRREMSRKQRDIESNRYSLTHILHNKGIRLLSTGLLSRSYAVGVEVGFVR